MEMDCPASAVPASCNTGIQMDASHLRSCCAPQWNICLTQLVVLFLCNETQRWNKTHLQRQRVIKDRALEQVLKCGCLLESYHLAFPTPTSWCTVLFPQLFKVVKCMELGSSEHSFKCRSHSNKLKKKVPPVFMQGISRYIVDSRMRQNYSLVSHSRPIRKIFIEVTQKSHQIFNTSS